MCIWKEQLKTMFVRGTTTPAAWTPPYWCPNLSDNDNGKTPTGVEIFLEHEGGKDIRRKEEIRKEIK